MTRRQGMVGSEFGILRDDTGLIVVNEEAADLFAEKMAHRFHAAIQKAKGGRPDGMPGVNPAAANQWGGKAIIKYNPTSDERQSGIQQEVALLTWQSPDGLPHYVTIDVGRLAGGSGGPQNDGGPGAQPSTTGIGGGTWPLGNVGGDTVNGAPLSYRACAQVLLGTPGTMQDPFYIDINRGQRFTALASYVVITAQMDPPPVNQTAYQGNGQPSIGPNGKDYVSGSMAVYATLGMAVAPSLTPVYFTQYIDMNNTGQGGLVVLDFSRIVPPRANILTPVYLNDATNLSNLVFYDNAGRPVQQPKALAAQPSAIPFTETPIVVPQDAYSVLFNPQVGSPGSYSWRLVWQLSV